jgi:hypothetical protein
MQEMVGHEIALNGSQGEADREAELDQSLLQVSYVLSALRHAASCAHKDRSLSSW